MALGAGFTRSATRAASSLRAGNGARLADAARLPLGLPVLQPFSVGVVGENWNRGLPVVVGKHLLACRDAGGNQPLLALRGLVLLPLVDLFAHGVEHVVTTNEHSMY